LIFLQGTFTPTVHAHAGRTQSHALGLQKASLLVPRRYAFAAGDAKHYVFDK